jgi:hypothetical protein
LAATTNQSTTGAKMIPYCWIEKQVFSLGLPELKRLLGVKRLRFSRGMVVVYLQCLMSHHFEQLCFTEVHRDNAHRLEVKYAAFMRHMTQVGRMGQWLFVQHQKETGIGFDRELNIIDASLLPVKEEKSITQKDWNQGRVTRRTKQGKIVDICGEKALLIIRKDNCIAHAELMASINASEMNVLKHPMVLATMGLRSGDFLADKGFSCKITRQGFAALNQSSLNFNVNFIAPYHAKSKVQLTPKERHIYKSRWKIETLFGLVKHKRKRFRLCLAGVRSKALVKAKFFLSMLAWNWSLKPA